MDGTETLLARACEAYVQGDRAATHRDVTCVREQMELSTTDLDLLGSATWWVADVGTSLAISEDV